MPSDQCPQCGAVAWIKDPTGPWEAQIIVQLDAIMGFILPGSRFTSSLRQHVAVKVATQPGP